MSEWIRTSERLPEIGQRVLGVTYGYGNDILVIRGGETKEEALRRCRREPVVVNMFVLWEGGWSNEGTFPLGIDPTYWMPLPSPPEYREEEL